MQEYKFTRIAQRYREGFKESDPAALALMERICLFRLGVTADTPASIFTGPGEDKQAIAGPALAALSREELQRKLERLVAMKLIEASMLKTASQSGRAIDVQAPSGLMVAQSRIE